ncbi:MAG: TrkA family potassium uptake protein [Candidatus Omnitrophica bacterium]|nr:TrkA family potassium uptake protein [Candidatus Omnitrophota bacterium]
MKYIVIVGCGRTGAELARDLSPSANVVIIDKNLKALDSLGEDFNGKKVWGDGLDLHTLEEAEIKQAHALFLLTGNDNLNLVVGKVVKRRYQVPRVILQVNDVVKEKIFREAGLTIVNRTSLLIDVLKKYIT